MFTIKMQEGVIATSYSVGDKFHIDPMKLLPLERFTGAAASGGGGRGGGRGKSASATCRTFFHPNLSPPWTVLASAIVASSSLT